VASTSGGSPWRIRSQVMTGEDTAPSNLETILRPGQTVAGKYCVESLIAAGGMAAVWSGVHLSTGKRVALKVILRSFALTPGADELFRSEALVASRVNHPNVVTIFDVVEHEGRTCIVMELLDGEDLGAYFARKGLLSVQEALALLLPAMHGVAAANAQGVVHRDLKPQNVFLCMGPDGRVVTTKILDFGISVMAAQASAQRTTTVQLSTHGTPAYMSPEHITGAPNIDERADVYGFGVILFEALAGQVPFVGDPGPVLLMRILEEPAPELTRFRPDIPREMDAIIERAIAKNPDDRFPTLNHFIETLEQHFLPRSPMLRALTPMVGVPLLASGSGPSGLADPIVQVARRPEPSGGYESSVTKALFVLPRSGTAKDEEESSRPPALPENTSDPRSLSRDDVELAPPARDMQMRVRVRRLLAIASFVGVTAAGLGWVLIPDRARHRPTDHRPEATAGPTTPRSMPPVAAPVGTGEASPLVHPQQVPERHVQALPSRVDKMPTDGLSWSHSHREAKPRAMRAVSRPRAMRSPGVRGKSAEPAPDHASKAEPTPNPSSLIPPPQRTGPRAGSLSPDDF
jgi:serine/threonine protein kinase